MTTTRTAPPHSPWLSTEGVAEYLGVSIDTVRSWRYRGVGPVGSKAGKHVRYHVDDVDRWMREQAASSVA